MRQVLADPTFASEAARLGAAPRRDGAGDLLVAELEDLPQPVAASDPAAPAAHA